MNEILGAVLIAATCVIQDPQNTRRAYFSKSTIPKAERKRRTAHKKAVKRQNRRQK